MTPVGAVGGIPEATATLVSDPHRSALRVEERRVVQRQHAVGVGESLSDLLDEGHLNLFGVPRRIGQEVLEPIGIGARNPTGHRLHRLAPAGKEKPRKILLGVSVGVAPPRSDSPAPGIGAEEVPEARTPLDGVRKGCEVEGRGRHAGKGNSPASVRRVPLEVRPRRAGFKPPK